MTRCLHTMSADVHQLQEIIGTYRAIEEERQAGLLKIEAQSVALAELRQEHDTVLSAQEEKVSLGIILHENGSDGAR